MKVRMLVAGSVAAAGLIAAPMASAQGTVTPEGKVPSYVELVLGQPAASFSTFRSAKTYTTSFTAAVTISDQKATLSVTDGDVTKGSKIGRLANGSKLLPEPLEARVGKSSAFAPLDSAMDLPLARFTTVQANSDVKVDLRQKVEKKTSGSYRKLLLVTLSSDTP